ncbi:caspase-3-like [Syngnathus typhle]|uniref:caspase-3-like n=1 Tax=Syngnathus typhle TaxID=161592 RepID=UPI002A69DF83|nr:caspase-3-like [Syngnathus typhle]XP_061132688.1 caspase-3-like [Syngnathus typhle]
MAATKDAGSLEKSEDTVDACKLPNFLKYTSKRTNPSDGSNKAEETDSVPISKASAHNPYQYRMDYPNMGICLIINNKNFYKSTRRSTRDGTDVDAAFAEKTFEELGYTIKVATDQTAKQMMSLMLRVSQEDHSCNASFVCVLLSHGDEGVISGTDRDVMLENLAEPFKGHRCKTLVGKPKLFFIQACRGKKTDSGTGLQADSVEEQRSGKIPVEADFLYAYSTAPGYFAWRNQQNGSWFMQALCEMLQRFKGELELMHIMTRVNYKVATHFESNSDHLGFTGKKQIPCIVSMLTKDVYFPK